MLASLIRFFETHAGVAFVDAPPRSFVPRAGRDIAADLRQGLLDVERAAGMRSVMGGLCPPSTRGGAAEEWAPELVATDEARRRLREWEESGRPAPRPEKLRVFGDADMVGYVHAALGSMDAPAAEYVARHCSVVAIGLHVNGLHMPGGLPSGPALIVTGRQPDTIARVMWHEAAHAWLKAETDSSGSVEFRHELVDLSRREGWFEQVRAQVDRDEREAEALAARWERRMKSQEV